MSARRDYGSAAWFGDEVTQAVDVIRAVGQHLPGRQALDQIASRSHVVVLAESEGKVHRQAERIDYSVDLGAEPAS